MLLKVNYFKQKLIPKISKQELVFPSSLSNTFCRTEKLQKIGKIQSCRIKPKKKKKINVSLVKNFKTKTAEVGKRRKALQVAVVLFLFYKTSTSKIFIFFQFPWQKLS